MAKKAKDCFIGSEPDSIGILARRYLKHRELGGVREDTLIGYRSKLRLFINWCEDRGLELIGEISREIMEGYARHLAYRKIEGEEKTLRQSSRENNLKTIQTFFKWLTRRRLVLYNPASEIAVPKRTPAALKDILSAGEIESILSKADISNPVYLRDRTIMEIFYATGIRRRELRDLETGDLNLDERTLMVRRGKNGQGRLLPLGHRGTKWSRHYLKKGRDALLKNGTSDSLFLTVNGTGMSLSLINPTLKKYFSAAGVKKTGCSHLFRHSMATLMLKNGADIRVVQEILGHNKISTTQLYTHLNIEHLKLIHQATHPASTKDNRQQGTATSGGYG